MDNVDLLQEFNQVIRNVFFNPSITVDNESTSFDVDGWDSLSHVRLIMELEKHFSIKLADCETASAANVGELINIIRNRMQHD